MKRTVSIPLDIDPETYLPLMKKCAEIYNLHVDWALENGSYNKSKAHADLYQCLRQRFPEIPSGLIQSTRDAALEAVKATRFEKRPRKKPTSAVRYDKRTMTLRGCQLTFSAIGARRKTILNVPKYFMLIVEKWSFKGGNICYQEGRIWAKLWFEKKDGAWVETNELAPEKLFRANPIKPTRNGPPWMLSSAG